MTFTPINPLPTAKLLRYQKRYDGYNGSKRNNYNPNWEEYGDPVGHKGADLEAENYLEDLVACAHGWCHQAGWLNGGAGYGENLWHPDDPTNRGKGTAGWLSRAIHMNRNGPVHDVGDEVDQGEKIGEVGSQGITGYPHVHFEIRRVENYLPWVAAVNQGIPYDPVDLGIFTNVPGGPVEPPVGVEPVTFEVTKAVLYVQSAPYTEDPAVQTLQYELNKLGMLNMAAGINYDKKTGMFDGKFGPSTKASVETFQTSENLASDGVVGSATWAALLTD